MGILERIKNLVRANAADLARGSRDPEAILEEFIADVRDHLAEAEEVLACERLEHERLRRQRADAASERDRWRRKAISCVGRGDDVLGREAVKRHIEARELEADLARKISVHKAVLADLDQSMTPLRRKIEESERQLRDFGLRSRYLKAQAAIGRKPSPADDAVETVRDRMLDLESEVEAVRELREKDFTSRLFELTAPVDKDKEIELELQRLKAVAREEQRRKP